MKPIKFLLLFFIILGIIIILVQNHMAFATTVVFNINLLFAEYKTPEINIYIISAVSLILGFLVTWVYFMLERFQLKRQINSLRKESREKDNELNSLRNLPITSEDVAPDIQEDDAELTYED